MYNGDVEDERDKRIFDKIFSLCKNQLTYCDNKSIAECTNLTLKYLRAEFSDVEELEKRIMGLDDIEGGNSSEYNIFRHIVSHWKRLPLEQGRLMLEISGKFSYFLENLARIFITMKKNVNSSIENGIDCTNEIRNMRRISTWYNRIRKIHVFQQEKEKNDDEFFHLKSIALPTKSNLAQFLSDTPFIFRFFRRRTFNYRKYVRLLGYLHRMNNHETIKKINEIRRESRRILPIDEECMKDPEKQLETIFMDLFPYSKRFPKRKSRKDEVFYQYGVNPIESCDLSNVVTMENRSRNQTKYFSLSSNGRAFVYTNNSDKKEPESYAVLPIPKDFRFKFSDLGDEFAICNNPFFNRGFFLVFYKDILVGRSDAVFIENLGNGYLSIYENQIRSLFFKEKIVKVENYHVDARRSDFLRKGVGWLGLAKKSPKVIGIEGSFYVNKCGKVEFWKNLLFSEILGYSINDDEREFDIIHQGSVSFIKHHHKMGKMKKKSHHHHQEEEEEEAAPYVSEEEKQMDILNCYEEEKKKKEIRKKKNRTRGLVIPELVICNHSPTVWKRIAQVLYEMRKWDDLKILSSILERIRRGIWFFNTITNPADTKLFDFSPMYQKFILTLHFIITRQRSSHTDDEFPLSKISTDVLEHKIIPFISEMDVFISQIPVVKRVIELRSLDFGFSSGISKIKVDEEVETLCKILEDPSVDPWATFESLKTLKNAMNSSLLYSLGVSFRVSSVDVEKKKLDDKQQVTDQIITIIDSGESPSLCFNDFLPSLFRKVFREFLFEKKDEEKEVEEEVEGEDDEKEEKREKKQNIGNYDKVMSEERYLYRLMAVECLELMIHIIKVHSQQIDMTPFFEIITQILDSKLSELIGKDEIIELLHLVFKFGFSSKFNVSSEDSYSQINLIHSIGPEMFHALVTNSKITDVHQYAVSGETILCSKNSIFDAISHFLKNVMVKEIEKKCVVEELDLQSSSLNDLRRVISKAVYSMDRLLSLQDDFDDSKIFNLLTQTILSLKKLFVLSSVTYNKDPKKTKRGEENENSCYRLLLPDFHIISSFTRIRDNFHGYATYSLFMEYVCRFLPQDIFKSFVPSIIQSFMKSDYSNASLVNGYHQIVKMFHQMILRVHTEGGDSLDQFQISLIRHRSEVKEDYQANRILHLLLGIFDVEDEKHLNISEEAMMINANKYSFVFFGNICEILLLLLPYVKKMKEEEERRKEEPTIVLDDGEPSLEEEEEEKVTNVDDAVVKSSDENNTNFYLKDPLIKLYSLVRCISNEPFCPLMVVQWSYMMDSARRLLEKLSSYVENDILEIPTKLKKDDQEVMIAKVVSSINLESLHKAKALCEVKNLHESLGSLEVSKLDEFLDKLEEIIVIFSRIPTNELEKSDNNDNNSLQENMESYEIDVINSFLIFFKTVDLSRLYENLLLKAHEPQPDSFRCWEDLVEEERCMRFQLLEKQKKIRFSSLLLRLGEVYDNVSHVSVKCSDVIAFVKNNLSSLEFDPEDASRFQNKMIQYTTSSSSSSSSSSSNELIRMSAFRFQFGMALVAHPSFSRVEYYQTLLKGIRMTSLEGNIKVNDVLGYYEVFFQTFSEEVRKSMIPCLIDQVLILFEDVFCGKYLWEKPEKPMNATNNFLGGESDQDKKFRLSNSVVSFLQLFLLGKYSPTTIGSKVNDLKGLSLEVCSKMVKIFHSYLTIKKEDDVSSFESSPPLFTSILKILIEMCSHCDRTIIESLFTWELILTILETVFVRIFEVFRLKSYPLIGVVFSHEYSSLIEFSLRFFVSLSALIPHLFFDDSMSFEKLEKVMKTVRTTSSNLNERSFKDRIFQDFVVNILNYLYKKGDFQKQQQQKQKQQEEEEEEGTEQKMGTTTSSDFYDSFNNNGGLLLVNSLLKKKFFLDSIRTSRRFRRSGSRVSIIYRNVKDCLLGFGVSESLLIKKEEEGEEIGWMNNASEKNEEEKVTASFQFKFDDDDSLSVDKQQQEQQQQQQQVTGSSGNGNWDQAAFSFGRFEEPNSFSFPDFNAFEGSTDRQETNNQNTSTSDPSFQQPQKVVWNGDDSQFSFSFGSDQSGDGNNNNISNKSNNNNNNNNNNENDNNNNNNNNSGEGNEEKKLE